MICRLYAIQYIIFNFPHIRNDHANASFVSCLSYLHNTFTMFSDNYSLHNNPV